MKIAFGHRAELVVGSLLSLLVFVLLIVRVGYAGGLWRDECAAVQLAQMPNLADMVRLFPHEAFPLLFPITLRGFIGVFGTTDFALRLFGFFVGMAFIGAAWLGALLNKSVPLLCLTLVGLNPSFLTFGTSVRGYGLGVTFILLAFGLYATVITKAKGTRIIVATVVSIVCVQFLLHNVVLLLCIGASAACVCLLRGDRRSAIVIVGLAVFGAASLLPEMGSYREGTSWNIVLKSHLSPSFLWSQLNSAFGPPSGVMSVIWICLFVILFGMALRRLRVNYRRGDVADSSVLLFSILVLFASAVGYFIFLKVLSYATRDWYYLALITVWAAAMDLIVTSCFFDWARVGRLILVIALGCLLPFAGWTTITTRQTNSDLVAHAVEVAASPADLIVVTPWQLGIPFNWYYHGKTSWITVPNIADHRIHRYDLFKDKMISSDPIEDIVGKVRVTLQAGGRVWFVGGIEIPTSDHPLLMLAPAPDPRFQWDNVAYMESWRRQLGAFLKEHALRGNLVKLPDMGAISNLEHVPLVVVQGWRE